MQRAIIVVKICLIYFQKCVTAEHRIEQEHSLKILKQSIKSQKTLHCLCKLCEIYINGEGLVQVSN